MNRIMAVFGILPLISLSAGQYNFLTYEINNGKVTITDYDPLWSESTVVIPTTIEGNPVTSIGESAFFDSPDVTRIVIPNTVSTINDDAFMECPDLTHLTLPSGLTTIGARAFYDCSNLEEISIPSNVTTIESDTFSGCTSLTNVTLPEGLRSIGARAFYNCSSLSKLVIPLSVVGIYRFSFYNCDSLDDIFIPKNVWLIGESAFAACTSLMNITVDADNSNYSSSNGVLFNKLKTTLIQFPHGKSGSYSVPSGITEIESSAFSSNVFLTSITLAHGLTSIKSQSFLGCSALLSINIPDSVTNIGFNTFGGCASLTNIFIPDSVTYINGTIFSRCDLLKEITVDSANPSYSSIDGILYNKTGTTLIECPPGKSGKVVIPDGVEVIDELAFSNCKSLIEITLSNTITDINDSAFLNCNYLRVIDLSDNLAHIGQRAFQSCSNLRTITIPANVTNISNNAFASCSNLTSAIFRGDVPDTKGSNIFVGAGIWHNFYIYYYENAEGFTTPTWANYSTVELSLSSDYDNDLLTNNLERLLGTSPIDENSRLLVWLSRIDSGYKLHYGPHSESCQFKVQSTSDLSDPESWEVVQGLSFSGDTSEQIADIIPVSGGAAFYRVQVRVIE